MDHKALLASLEDEQRKYLTEKSDLAGLLMLLSHLIGVFATGLYIHFGGLFWQAVLVAHGIQLVFFFTLLHETVHDTPFASPWLNSVARWLSAFIVILPPIWFRYFHLAHHRHTHDPENDPELDNTLADGWLSYVWMISGVPVWFLHIKTLTRNASGRFDYPYLPKRLHVEVAREARLMIVIYLLLASVSFLVGTSAVIYLWLMPLLLGQPFLRLYLMAEHGRCPHVANMLENTRTTFTNRFVRWLAWNMPYHAEHHAFPNVPFHKLPDFHRVAKKHLKTTENGYTAFHRKQLDAFSEELGT